MADTKTTFGFEHKGIGQVLSHYRLVVPLNQREYAWEDEHVRDLFQDFAAALDKARGTYFLGTVVLTRGEHGTLEVSDGQQRLATTTILLAAIRDYLFLNGHKKRADSLQPFLGEIDFSTEKTVPKLTLNVDDNDYFVRRVLSEPESEERKKVEPTKDSHRKIDNAAILAAEHVAAILKPFGKEAHAERLGVWKDFIESGAEVILLSVPDHLNAFVMFETLNDRGLKASQADLLKNHLLRHAGNERMREAQQKWSQMVGALESLTEDDMTVSYLRSLLIAKFGPTREREVFNRVKEEVGSQQRALDFLQELKDGASDFVAMLNPNHRKWNDYNPSTRKHVAQLLGLRVEQIRPLLFAVSRYFDAKEAAKAFKLFVSWSVRFLIAGGRGGTLDSNYARVAHEVGTRKITDAAGLAASMKEIVPSDAVFEASFGDAIVSRSFLARYYLRALELRVKGEAEPELVPNEEEQVINLEHVLPENPGTGWPGVAPDVASAYYKRLGNMVLLQATKNSTLGNSPFADKQKVLSESAFMLTQDVGKSSHWTEKEIAERQKQLAKLAVETWPIEVR